MHRFTPRFWQKRYISLRVFAENAWFASSLNTLYTAKSAQFYSAFSPTTISLTPRFRRKREVWLCFFAENAQNDQKTHSYEDSTKFNSAFLETTLSHASHFRRKRRVIENFEYLREFKEYIRKCWLDCVLYLFSNWKIKKKFKNRLWTSRACVPLRWKNQRSKMACQLASLNNYSLTWRWQKDSWLMCMHHAI
jgi:hypothetical protein